MPAGYKTRWQRPDHIAIVNSTPTRLARMEHAARLLFRLFHLLLLLFLLGSLVGGQLQLGMRPNALLRGSDSEHRSSNQRQQQTRPPLLMMQLYRTMLTEDRDRDRDMDRDLTAAARVSHIVEESNPALHDSDAVISLVAKSEYSDLTHFNSNFLWTSGCVSVLSAEATFINESEPQ